MDILQLFNFLSSESEEQRNYAYQMFENFFHDPNFCNILFDLLSTEKLEPIYYILTARCLRTWFRRNIIPEDKQTAFIQRLQSFLLINHPAQKDLFLLYKSSIHEYCSDAFFFFLGNSINILSIETPPEFLSCFLKLAYFNSKGFFLNLDSRIVSYIGPIYLEIKNRLFGILQNSPNYITTPAGCSIIRFSFKFIIFTQKNLPTSEEYISLIFNVLKLIVDHIEKIVDHEFYKLVKFCIKILTLFKKFSFNPIINKLDASDETKDMICNNSLSLIFQYIISLSPYHVPCINQYLKSIYNETQIIPDSPESIQLFAVISTLTQNDLCDFNDNPSVFYEYAYSTVQNSNMRKTSFDIVNKKCASNVFLNLLLNLPPAEPSMYLICSSVHESIRQELNDAVFQWITNCLAQKVPFQSPLEMSTFLFLISKSVSLILPADFIMHIIPLVFNIIILSQNESNDVLQTDLCPKEFIVACSKCLVTVTNAVRAARKILKKEIVDFPPQLIFAVIQLLPFCPSSDASRFIESFVKSAYNDPDKTSFILSQVDLIKSNLCAAATAALSSSLLLEDSFDSQSFTKLIEKDDYKIIGNALNALETIIQSEQPSPSVTPEMLQLFQLLFANFDREFSDELISLISIIFKSGNPISCQIILNLTEMINSNSYFLGLLDKFYILYDFFIILFHDDFLSMNITHLIIHFGIEAIKSKANIKNEAVCLICVAIFTDLSFDVTPIIELINSQETVFDIETRALIMMAIIVSRPQFAENRRDLIPLIIQLYIKKNTNYAFKVRLAEMTLLIMLDSDDLMNAVIELISIEKNIRMDDKIDFIPTPMDLLNIADLVQNALQKCSDENRQNFMNSISEILS